MKALLFPLLILGSVTAYLAGLGIESAWRDLTQSSPLFPVHFLISIALHLGWITPAAKRRLPALTIVGWLVSLHFCDAGLAAAGPGSHSMSYSFLAEILSLLLALALTPRSSWGERLARWRRARAEIAIQARMGEGIFRWVVPVLRQSLVGPPIAPPGGDFRRFTAELSDAEQRLRIRLRSTILPEQIRQSMLSSASELVGRAEAAAAQTGFDLERSALAASASCREQLEEMDDITPDRKSALAAQCESLFLELIAPARNALTPSTNSVWKEERIG